MEKTSTSSDGLAPSGVKQTPKAAELTDIEHILELSKKFVQKSPYRDVGVDDNAVRNLVTGLIVSESGIVFCTDGGFILGGLAPLHFNPSVALAAELAWYAEDGAGAALREAFEARAKELGAQAVQMTALGNEHVERLTKNLSESGYVPVEVSFIKAL